MLVICPTYFHNSFICSGFSCQMYFFWVLGVFVPLSICSINTYMHKKFNAPPKMEYGYSQLWKIRGFQIRRHWAGGTAEFSSFID